MALRETQSGIDPTELPRLLANAMTEETWVADTLRKPANNIFSGSDKAHTADMIEKLKPPEATENADLKNLVQANLAYLQEETKDNPDSSKASDLSAAATKRLSALGTACH